MKTYTILRGSQRRSTVMIAATTAVFAGFFILWSNWAYAITPEHVIDEVAPGSLSAWEVTDEEYNPVMTYEEVISPYDGSTAIQTSVVGNTISMCETKSLKRTYAYGGNTSDTDLQAYLAFTSSLSYYNLPYVLVQLLDEADTVIEYHVYYGTNATGSYYEGIIASNPDSYTKLPSEAGDFVLDLAAMGSDIDFASFSVILANYTCEGENSTIFDHLRMIGGTPPNTPPVADASSFSVVQGATYYGSVSGSDGDGDALTFEALDSPMYGSRQFFPDGTFTYTADADYAGDDTFTFAATDGKASSEPATVSITITEQTSATDVKLLIYNPNVPGKDDEPCKGEYGAIPYEYLEDNGVTVTVWCNDTVVDAAVLADYDVLYVGRARAEYETPTYIDSADLTAWVAGGGGAILESTGDSFEPGTSDIIWPGIYELFGYNNCPVIGSSDNAGGGPLQKLIDHPIWDGVTGPVGDGGMGLYDSELTDDCIGTGVKIGTAATDAQNPLVNEYGRGRTYSGVLVDYTLNEDSKRYFLNVVRWVAANSEQRDTTSPVITLQGEAEAEVPFGTDYNDAGATAEDDVDGVVPVITSGIVDTTTPGTYTITYTAVDSAGNESALTRQVTVLEEERGGRSSGTRVGERRETQERGQVLGASTSADEERLMQQREIVRLLQQLVELLTTLLMRS